MSTLVNPQWPAGLEARLGEDTRNVIDHYKYWDDEAIREDLDTKRSELHVLFENFAHDFNIATGIRNANAFVVGEVWIGGRASYDRRGTVGTHNYEHIKKDPSSVDIIKAHKELGYRIVVADNIEGAFAVQEYTWAPKTLLVMGQEAIGVSQAAIDLADDVVFIEQMGSVRSLNVGVASGIMIHEYNRQVVLGA